MTKALKIGYLNGEFGPVDELRIPVLDRGFLFGDAVYEVVPVYHGKPFRNQQHFQRLVRSLNQIQMEPVMDYADWEDLVAQLVSRNGGGSMAIYAQVTRGADDGRNHLIDNRLSPTVFAMATPMRDRGTEILNHGLKVMTRDDSRWARCDIKSTSLLANILLYSEAHTQGAQECLLHRNGLLTEGSSSSVFVVRGGEIHVPPYSPEILPGTTRDLVIELCEANKTPAQLVPIPMSELRLAQEVWIASSTRELLPVTRVDGMAVGDGVPGPVWKQIDTLFQEYKARQLND
jgi:D-alanine transaminase